MKDMSVGTNMRLTNIIPFTNHLVQKHLKSEVLFLCAMPCSPKVVVHQSVFPEMLNADHA